MSRARAASRFCPCVRCSRLSIRRTPSAVTRCPASAVNRAFTSAGSDDSLIRKRSSTAVEAYANAGDPQSALRVAMQIVDLHHAAGRSGEVARFARLTLKPLRRDGHAAEADAISAYIARATGGAWSDPDAPKLPAFCSNCGAAVKPAEVARPTPTTVACPR